MFRAPSIMSDSESDNEEDFNDIVDKLGDNLQTIVEIRSIFNVDIFAINAQIVMLKNRRNNLIL